MRKRFLYWLAKRFSDWSYDLCDVSSRLTSIADGPPKPFVPKNEFDKTLHEIFLNYYSNLENHATFLIDKVGRAKVSERVDGRYLYKPAKYE